MQLPRMLTAERQWRAGLVLAVTVGLAGCGGYEPVHFPQVPVPAEVARAATDSKVRKAVEFESFVTAMMLYPSRGARPHTVMVGNYLANKLIANLPDDPRISQIRLDRYFVPCQGKGAFPVMLVCSIDFEMTVAISGKLRRIAVKEDKNAGPMIAVGDISPPFNWGSKNTRYVQAQARIVAEASAQAASGKIKAALNE